MVMTLVVATLEGVTGPRATVRAKVCSASYLERSASSSSRMLAFSEASFSTSRCSATRCRSNSSFCVTRLMRQLAAVRRRCLSRTTSSLDRPRRCWFSSRTDMDTSSSSLSTGPFSPASFLTCRPGHRGRSRCTHVATTRLHGHAHLQGHSPRGCCPVTPVPGAGLTQAGG
ncbi:hypothetical protein QTO34_016412 [Cnephaeus nilssonii]|uniref:Uncharacterized protein n=1 Tax=Cnephaeus nilssonii TaxID=3371016 RepID=A0AA40I6Z6_CNENI|nr:hypothetical protein QTO34_016412 [Eptesicus nilssonii]